MEDGQSADGSFIGLALPLYAQRDMCCIPSERVKASPVMSCRH